MVILQQALCLVVTGWLIYFELVEEVRPLAPPRWIQKVFHYREYLMHFLMGILLNSYTIFYFKSASALHSFVFIFLLMALLTINEFKRFGKSQARVHVAFWSLCLISYFVSLVPIVLGFIGHIPFTIAVMITLAIYWGYQKWVSRALQGRTDLVRSHLLIPFASIQAVFVLFYVFEVIPPVPLSVSYMGIYHDVKKSNGEYQLSSMRPWWKVWQKADQEFLARPGDSLYCFVRVFSPTRFSDQLQIRWLKHEGRRGWVSQDSILMPVLGGRDDGYRWFTRKTNYSPGEWRVQIETMNGREVGRTKFTVIEDSSSEPREFTVETQ